MTLKDKDSNSSKQKTGMLTGSLSSGFLSYNDYHCIHRYHLVLFMLSCENWGSESRHKMLILWLLPLLWVINCLLSLTQESCVFYWHLWNWKTNVLVCDWDKVSNPSKFLTLSPSQSQHVHEEKSYPRIRHLLCRDRGRREVNEQNPPTATPVPDTHAWWLGGQKVEGPKSNAD